MTETAIAAAMRKAGVPTDVMEVITMAYEALKGRTPWEAQSPMMAMVRKRKVSIDTAIAALLKTLHEVDKSLPGEGRFGHAENGPVQIADARQPDADAVGHCAPADNGHGRRAPASAPNGDGVGQCGFVERGHGRHARSSPPVADGGLNHRAANGPIRVASVREPSPTALAASRKVQMTAARTRLERYGWLGSASVPDGMNVTELRCRDLPGSIERLVREGGRMAQIAIALKVAERELEKYGPAVAERKWVDVLGEDVVRNLAAKTRAEVLMPMAAGWLNGLSAAGLTAIEAIEGETHG